MNNTSGPSSGNFLTSQNIADFNNSYINTDFLSSNAGSTAPYPSNNRRTPSDNKASTPSVSGNLLVPQTGQLSQPQPQQSDTTLQLLNLLLGSNLTAGSNECDLLSGQQLGRNNNNISQLLQLVLQLQQQQQSQQLQLQQQDLVTQLLNTLLQQQQAQQQQQAAVQVQRASQVQQASQVPLPQVQQHQLLPHLAGGRANLINNKTTTALQSQSTTLQLCENIAAGGSESNKFVLGQQHQVIGGTSSVVVEKSSVTSETVNKACPQAEVRVISYPQLQNLLQGQSVLVASTAQSTTPSQGKHKVSVSSIKTPKTTSVVTFQTQPLTSTTAIKQQSHLYRQASHGILGNTNSGSGNASCFIGTSQSSPQLGKERRRSKSGDSSQKQEVRRLSAGSVPGNKQGRGSFLVPQVKWF